MAKDDDALRVIKQARMVNAHRCWVSMGDIVPHLHVSLNKRFFIRKYLRRKRPHEIIQIAEQLSLPKLVAIMAKESAARPLPNSIILDGVSDDLLHALKFLVRKCFNASALHR